LRLRRPLLIRWLRPLRKPWLPRSSRLRLSCRRLHLSRHHRFRSCRCLRQLGSRRCRQLPFRSRRSPKPCPASPCCPVRFRYRTISFARAPRGRRNGIRAPRPPRMPHWRQRLATGGDVRHPARQSLQGPARIEMQALPADRQAPIPFDTAGFSVLPGVARNVLLARGGGQPSAHSPYSAHPQGIR
jgi:hypothetical protein